jgi:DNA ligase (NAD+)
VVITGKIEGLTRDEITSRASRSGARVQASIDRKGVDLLIVGERAGSKLRKARERGIPVMTWAEARKLMEAAGAWPDEDDGAAAAASPNPYEA